MQPIQILLTALLFSFVLCQAQSVKFDKNNIEPNQVTIALEKMDGREVVKIVKDRSVATSNAPTFAKIKGIEFKDGIIEVSVLSKLLPDAPSSARGFIGVAFRITSDNSKFESIYLRPTNGRADDQVRRNHSIQYFSFPDYDFDRFRKEAPEKYESYADMGLNEWIRMKIVVKGMRAELFLNDNKQPSLIVTDLKHGADLSGGIGLWLDGGTEAYFSDLKVQRN